jgi:type II secretory pathway component PulM
MMFEAQITQVRDRWERLSTRERMLVSIMGGVFLLMLTLGAGYFITDGIDTVEEANADARQALHDLDTQRDSYLKAKAKEADVEKRLGKTPVALQGFLEQVAKDVGVEIPEFNELAPQAAGKQFTERSVTIRLKSVTLDSLAKFLRGVETGPNLVVVTALNVHTRDDKHEDLEVEMTVTTYEHAADKKDKGSKKGDKT